MTNDTDISGGSEHKDSLKSIIDYCIESFIYIYLQKQVFVEYWIHFE